MPGAAGVADGGDEFGAAEIRPIGAAMIRWSIPSVSQEWFS
jgi:hypothetical protein